MIRDRRLYQVDERCLFHGNLAPVSEISAWWKLKSKGEHPVDWLSTVVAPTSRSL